MVNMKNVYILVALVVIVGGFLLFDKNIVPQINRPVACTMDAKMCPDGSYVGRTGPNCEFQSCPNIVTPKDGKVTLSVGQTGGGDGFSIKFNSFIQDYRCPVDVVCIQGGAIVVNVTMTHDGKVETRNFPSDEAPYLFDGRHVSIVDIAPPALSTKQIKESEYRITFLIK